MQLFLKILAFSFGIVALFVVGLILLNTYHYWQNIEVIEAAEEFGRDATKDDCLAMLAENVAACEEVSCTKSDALFAAICLDVAEGNRNLYCDGASIRASLPRDYCADAQSSKICSPALTGTLLAYCVDSST